MHKIKQILDQRVLNEHELFGKIKDSTQRAEEGGRLVMLKRINVLTGAFAVLLVLLMSGLFLGLNPLFQKPVSSDSDNDQAAAAIPAYAMVSIDINPSFEIYLASDGRVEQVKPVNEDAVALVQSHPSDFLAMIGESVGQASRSVIRLALDAGYSREEIKKYIVVSTVVLDEEDPDGQANQDAIGKLIKDALSEPGALDEATKVEVIKATLREKRAADEAKIPLGLYILKGIYTGPDTDVPIKVADFVKNPEALAQLEKRSERIEAKEIRASERQETKESRQTEQNQN